MRRAFGWMSVVVLLVVAATAQHVWRNREDRSRKAAGDAVSQVGSPVLSAKEPVQPPASRQTAEPPGVALDPAAPPAKRSHRLLGDAEAWVVRQADGEVHSAARPELVEIAQAVLDSDQSGSSPASLTIDYPLDETIFPPEIVPPTFLWHEPISEADTWLIDVTWNGREERVSALSAGSPPPAGKIDPECISKNNEIYQPTPYQASARSWTPDRELWETIQQRSAAARARITILGMRSSAPQQVVSRGEISITTSEDPVGAPIFYRDVPLAPAVTQKGVIAPLGENAVGLIGWRLRDVGRPESRLLFNNVPTCTNCHSFSSDGKTLGMDLDGPDGDKGSYVLAPISREMAIGNRDVISWNSYADKPPGHKTIGFLSRVSPDGQFVATTLNEEVFVTNFLDYKFLQVFYPTRGILGYYSRSSGEIKALPGADDARFVHCDPVWSPDSEYLVFARAEAKDAYSKQAVLPERANDPAETPIQYDLYRMPFAGGKGGRPEPIAGASGNGMSNNFPKISPDGKWIVFVQCRNGQLMRPDSTLWIVPATGGTARKMRCNTRLMNSWHSFSPNGRWMVFSSKVNTPYTQMFLTHIDEEGNDSPPVLIPNSTAANRAVNIPEFVNRPYEELVSIQMKALEHLNHGMLGVQLARQGKLDEALVELEKAIELQPDYWQGHVNAAVVLIDQGKLDQAMARLKRVLQANPNRAHAYGSVGVALSRQGMLDEAIQHFKKAVELDPGYADAHANLAKILQKQGHLEEATAHFFYAMNIQEDNPVAHFELAGVLLERQMIDVALEHLQKAVELEPQFVDAHLVLAKVYSSQRNYAAAVAQFEKAAAADPNNLRPVNDLAWMLAICPEDRVRDGARAVQLAERACRVTGYSNPVVLSTLAAGYAEMGKFPEAIDTATKALGLVIPEDKVLAEGLQRQLQSYRSGRPCRDLLESN